MEVQYIINGKYFFLKSELKPGVDYFQNGEYLTENKECNRHSVRGVEYYSNGSIVDAIELRGKILKLQTCKQPQSLMLDFAIKNNITIQELKGLQLENNNRTLSPMGISEDDFISNAREYLNKLPKLSKLVTRKILLDWCYCGVVCKLKNGCKNSTDLNWIGMYVDDEMVNNAIKYFNKKIIT